MRRRGSPGPNPKPLSNKWRSLQIREGVSSKGGGKSRVSEDWRVDLILSSLDRNRAPMTVRPWCTRYIMMGDTEARPRHVWLWCNSSICYRVARVIWARADLTEEITVLFPRVWSQERQGVTPHRMGFTPLFPHSCPSLPSPHSSSLSLHFPASQTHSGHLTC